MQSTKKRKNNKKKQKQEKLHEAFKYFVKNTDPKKVLKDLQLKAEAQRQKIAARVRNRQNNPYKRIRAKIARG